MLNSPPIVLQASNDNASKIRLISVRFAPLPFYDIMGQVLRPIFLRPRRGQRKQLKRIEFQLNAQQVAAIEAGCDEADSDCRFRLQLHLRIGRFHLRRRAQRNQPPPLLVVSVNGTSVALPPASAPKSNAPFTQRLPPASAVDITPLLLLSPAEHNCVDLSWTHDESLLWAATLQIVHKLPTLCLLERIYQYGCQKTALTDHLIGRMLQQTDDVATTGLRFSTMCPIGLTRIRVPCRGALCSHLQCFDAENYLKVNELRGDWTCPICDRPADYWHLKLDARLAQLLVTAAPSVAEISFCSNGRVLFDGRPVTNAEVALGRARFDDGVAALLHTAPQISAAPPPHTTADFIDLSADD